MAVFRRSFAVATLLLSTTLPGQSTSQATSQATGQAASQAVSQPPPQLSPQAAYEAVTRPLEITRRAIGNWSDAETSALAVSIKQASEQCSTRAPEQFSGDELIAFARLCSLGQQWPVVSTAADHYLQSSDPAKPQLAQAYAYKVDASLHANDPKSALVSSQAMLKAVPYDTLVDQATVEALHYLQLAFTDDALTLYADREPLLLAAIHDPKPDLKLDSAAVPLHTLYIDGLAFAALQQFAGKPVDAEATVKDLDAALAALRTPLPNDDAIPIAAARRQYALLGKPLPHFPLSMSLFSQDETPRINRNYGSSTVLFLFPEWCAQCVRLGKALLPTLYRINDKDVHLYGLLAQVAPPRLVPLPKAKLNLTPEPSTAKTAADLLRGTPTLIVPPETLTLFAADDFPLLIATDPKGIVRFMQPASETALNPGDFLDQVTDHIARHWPREGSAKVANGTGSAQP